MKYILLFFISLSITIQPQAQALKSTEIRNDTYRFSADVPISWKLVANINDSVHNRMILAWALPAVFSIIEKTEIENAVSIMAYKDTAINSIDKLILQEYLRLDPTQWSMETDKDNSNARIIYGTINGNSYKGKSWFLLKNGTGYVINLTATPGTYHTNIAAFENFYNGIKFF